MNTRSIAEASITREAAFNDLLVAFQGAEHALEAYLAQPGELQDASVRRLLVQQLQQTVWTRYQEVRDHLDARRGSLPQL